MDISKNGSTERPSTPDPQCSICLDVLTNNCHTNKCSHLFCFDCLLSWSNVCLQQRSSSEPTCPLCKVTFRYIYHSFDGQGTHETYTVPILDRLPLPRLEIFGPQLLSELSELLHMSHGQFYLWPFQNYPLPSLQRPMDGQATRTEIYVANLYALPLLNPAGRQNNSNYYGGNPPQVNRLRNFIIRDLVAIRESVRLEGPAMPIPNNNDINGANMILQELRMFDIQQLRSLDHLRPFLKTRAEHFCRELINFVYSSYEISDYDRNVQYVDYLPPPIATTAPFNQEQSPPIHIVGETIVLDSDDEELQRPNIIEAPINQEQSPPIHIVGETIVLDSDDEELQRPNIIEVSSRNDGSDVEVPSQSSHSTDPHKWATIDQPSTSTGIRDSLVRPNHSFQFAYGGVSRVSHSSQVKRGSSDLDSSSDDEESIIATQGSHNAHFKSRDVNKKNEK